MVARAVFSVLFSGTSMLPEKPAESGIQFSDKVMDSFRKSSFENCDRYSRRVMPVTFLKSIPI